MTVLVRVMEESGLVERKKDPSDKRVTLVCLTEAGASYVRTRRQAGVDAYARLVDELTGDEVEAAGGRVLASIGSRVVAHEAGIAERVVLIEFDSFEQAVAAYESATYQEALAELPDGFERDFRIIEGLH